MIKKMLPVLLILFIFSYIPSYAQGLEKNKRMPSPFEMLSNSAQGREFYIAIPPNEVANYTPNVLEVYVTCAKKTRVTLSNPYNGLYMTKIVEPMQITVFSSTTGELGWDWEVRESEQITTKGLKLESEQPISVYVLNAKTYTSDGYLALPVTAWGKEYHHCSYYDFKEFGPWSGGFIVIAGEDNTKVTIRLNGIGKGQAKTAMGRNIGDIITVTLNAGQTYMVCGDAQTRGKFDLSGTKIIGNKNIGVISFHMRTIIPSFDIYNGRDCLNEMIPPIHAWGKKYVTVEYKRDSGMGDFFRIMASQDNTTFTCTYYDSESGKILGRVGGQLKRAGEFLEYYEVFTRTPNKIKSIRGTSVWEADKPVLLMQYAYSEEWDQNTVFDPFMILVVPQEQFISSTVFQTPASKAFVTNWFNIIATHDTTDKAFSDLKSLKIDGIPVHQLESKFTYNQIPETNLYWAKLPMQPGAHKITGNGKVKFGGYIYGFSQWDSYGWPAAMAINKLDETDTLPPVLNRIGQCGSFSFTATELRNGKDGDDPKQIDQGISQIELLDTSYNFVLTLVNPYKLRPPHYTAQFTVDVIDKQKNAYGIISVTDLYGNNSQDTIVYEAVNISLTPKELNFKNVRINTSKTMNAIIKNNGDSTIKLKSIKLQYGTYYVITSGGAPPEITLPSGATHEITIEYKPEIESLVETVRDKDSLEIISDCDTNKWYIHGRGVIPKILVEDWDAGANIVGKKVCKEMQTGNGLKISNTGSDTLTIFNIKNVKAPFELSSNYKPQTPFKLEPNGYLWVNTPCFTAPDVNSYSIDVLFESDAGSGDSISNWQGRGILPGPYVTSWDFGSLRQNSLREAQVYIRNSGNAPVLVSGVKLRNGNLGFSIKPGSIIPTPSVISPVSLVPEDSPSGTKEIALTVIYNPQTEGNFTEYVEAVFDIEEKIPDGSIYNWVKGSAYLPKIVLTGYEFNPAIVSGKVHPSTGYVKIQSVSQSAPLHIDEIRWKNQAQTEFSWVTPPPANLNIGMGDSLLIPVTFHPTKVGKITEQVEVVNDANPFPDSVIVTITDVIGYSFVQDVSVTDLNYGNLILCNNPIKSIFVENTGSGDITIDSIRFQSGDIANFKILNGNYPQVIPSLTSHEYLIHFIPTRTGNHFAELKVYTDIENDPTTTLRANVFDANLSLSMTKYDASNKLAPGYKIKPEISMNLDLPADASITSLSFDIIYKSSDMLYDKYIERGSALDASWNVSAVQSQIDDKYSKITIYCKGTNPIAAKSGVIALPRFLLLLSDTNKFIPEIADISVDSRDICVNKSSTNGEVILNTCVIDIRGVATSGIHYQLYDIEPNPVSGMDIVVKYSNSFDSYTKMEIVSSSGELIRTLIDGNQIKGEHEILVPINNLSSGQYFIRMSSGAYHQIKSLIISK